MNLTEADIKKSADGFSIDITAYSPTLGWSNVSLSVVKYVVEPKDGIQDLIIEGTPPTGIHQLPAIQLYHLSVNLEKNDWFKGVRIRNSSGEILRTLRTALVEAAPIGKDWCSVSSGGLQGDKVLLECSYSGGCQEHDFQLSWDGKVRKSLPGQIILHLSHNSNNDDCRALLNEQLQFDLSPVLENVQQYVIYVASENSTILVHRPTWQ